MKIQWLLIALLVLPLMAVVAMAEEDEEDRARDPCAHVPDPTE